MKRSTLAFIFILLIIMAAGCMNNPAQTTTPSTVTEPGTLAPMPASVLIGALINAGMPITHEVNAGVYILRICHHPSADDAQIYQAMFEKIVGH
jgi:hypothetical protein